MEEKGFKQVLNHSRDILTEEMQAKSSRAPKKIENRAYEVSGGIRPFVMYISTLWHKLFPTLR